MEPIDRLVESIKAAPLEASGDIYHPIPLDQFRGLKSAVNEAAIERKYQLIRTATPFHDLKGRKILDVGANAGYFAYQFAQLGGVVDAIEPHPRYFQLGKQIASHYNFSIEWHNEQLSQEFLEGKQYDIALMLSVFQWISRGNHGLKQAKAVLRQVSAQTDYLFFELGCNWGRSAIKVDGLALRWIVEMLRESTIYANIYYLGSTRLWGGWRSRWRFNRYMLCGTSNEINMTRWQRGVNWLIGRLWPPPANQPTSASTDWI